MLKKIAYFVVVFSSFSVLLMSDDQNQNYQEEEYENEDIWFGPGFYYGIWFENEQDYWGWRDNHWDYPPNRRYYNRDHPIEYHPEDHRDGERGRDRSPRHGEEHRGGHGGRGGGGHR
jgi:hypothetical protein